MDEKEISQAAPAWSAYVRAKQMLLKKNFIRSYKSTEADFAEWLVATILNGTLPENNSHTGYDVLVGDKKIQVKSVTKMWDNPNGYGVSKKDRGNNPGTGATHYAFVFFDELIPDAIFLVPENFVREFSKEQIKRADLDKTKYQVEIDLTAFKKAISSST